MRTHLGRQPAINARIHCRLELPPWPAVVVWILRKNVGWLPARPAKPMRKDMTGIIVGVAECARIQASLLVRLTS